MNIWKPLALVSMATTVLTVGASVAFAGASSHPGGVGAQPHMDAALAHLRAAKTELQAAEHNKGGWRDAAVLKTDGAIADTQRGIAFADTH